MSEKPQKIYLASEGQNRHIVFEPPLSPKTYNRLNRSTGPVTVNRTDEGIRSLTYNSRHIRGGIEGLDRLGKAILMNFVQQELPAVYLSELRPLSDVEHRINRIANEAQV